jgi:hypothetical protein
MKQNNKTRKLKAGYEIQSEVVNTVSFIEYDPFNFVLKKGNDTWSDPIRAISHLVNEIERLNKRIKELERL